jgi:hypothetical protein
LRPMGSAPTSCGLHDSRTAPRHDHDPSADSLFTRRPDDLAELAGHFVVAAFLRDAPGNVEAAAQDLVIRTYGQHLGAGFHRPPGGLRFADASAAKDHNRVGDPSLLEQAFRLQEVKLQADAARGVPLQEVHITIGFAIARRRQERNHDLPS